MIIECENCHTKFKVPGSAIDKDGRMVHCSVCEYEWLYKADQVASNSIPHHNTQIQNNTNNSIKRPTRMKISHLLGFFCILIIIAYSLYNYRAEIINHFPATTSMYQKFGYYNSKGLDIVHLGPITGGATNQALGGLKQFKIPIVIKNNSGQLRSLNAIKVLGYSKEKKIIFTVVLKILKDFHPNETIRISVISPVVHEKPKFVIVKIGNYRDLKNS